MKTTNFKIYACLAKILSKDKRSIHLLMTSISKKKYYTSRKRKLIIM